MTWNDLLQPEVVWTLVGMGMLIAEFVMPGLVIVFFGLGAILVGGICLFAELSLNEQLVVFLVSSVGMLISLRNSLTNALLDDEPDDATEVVGERAKVVQTITPGSLGRVEFHGSRWRAESMEAIQQGATVEIVGRDNLTLLVKSVERV